MDKIKRLNIVALCLLYSVCIFATDDSLITKQIAVCVDNPGSLSHMIGESKKYCITDLKLTGQINGDDIQFIREMAGGSTDHGCCTDGKLAKIHMSDAAIVSGGVYYYFDETSNHMAGVYSWNDVVGEYMFYGCRSLEKVSLPNTATVIKKCAFMGCNRLTEVILGRCQKTIGMQAFLGCSSLKGRKITENVETIEDGAFENCTFLSLVLAECKRPPLLGKRVFAGCYRKSCSLSVPQGSYNSYWLSAWGDFFVNIKEQNNGSK